jgi:hypothetical protein
MKTFKLVAIIFLIIFGFYSCKKDAIDSKTYSVKGFAQKGPFQTGTTITISELDRDLKPTGLNFYSTVSDNKGSFTIPNVKLNSSFVELMADGYYYNEEEGLVTKNRFVLKAIADLSDLSTVNVNILTHIIRDRLLYLIQNEKKTYKEAKKQAQNEVLSIFSLANSGSFDFEQFDLSKNGELNSKLLAISSILQGDKSESALSDLLTSISLDIKEDGKLDSKNIQTDIITSAILLNVGPVRKNLSNYYSDTIFTSFQAYCKKFIDSSSYVPLIKLNFPESLNNEKNILSILDNSTIQTNLNYIVYQDCDFEFVVEILKTSDTGEIEFIENDLTNCVYISPYCAYTGNNLSSYKCGVGVHFWQQSSRVPLKLKVTGSGEMMIRLWLPLPTGFFCTKYINW